MKAMQNPKHDAPPKVVRRSGYQKDAPAATGGPAALRDGRFMQHREKVGIQIQ